MNEQLSDQNSILMKLADLCVKPLPNDFIGTEVNNRLWEAFELGKQWQKCHLTSSSSSSRAAGACVCQPMGNDIISVNPLCPAHGMKPPPA
jgi:hypothetical protein